MSLLAGCCCAGQTPLSLHCSKRRWAQEVLSSDERPPHLHATAAAAQLQRCSRQIQWRPADRLTDCPAGWLPGCAGVVEALRGSHADILTLRHLVGGKLGLSKQATVVHSKEALWRLGQAIETGQDTEWSWLLGGVKLWGGVKVRTGGRMRVPEIRRLLLLQGSLR
jgi:hypothetical protein